MSRRDPAPKPVALPSLHEKLDHATSACKYWYGVVNDTGSFDKKMSDLQEIIDSCQKKIDHMKSERERAPGELAKYQKLVADLESRLSEERKVKAEPKIQKLAAGLKKNLAALEGVDLSQIGITEEQLAKMRLIVNTIKV
jgi:chromosome segregation ATPase